MMSRGLRLSSFLFAAVLACLASTKLFDLEGYLRALAAHPFVTDARAFEVGTLYAAVEATAALMLLFAALFGRASAPAFASGAALALASALGYAYLIVGAVWGNVDVENATLFGAYLALPARSPLTIALVVGLLAWSTWLLTASFMLPDILPKRRKRRATIGAHG